MSKYVITFCLFLSITCYSQEKCIASIDDVPSFGHITLDSMGDFGIGKIELGTMLDSVVDWFGLPLKEDSSEGVNVKVRIFHYHDFTVVFYGYYNGMSTSWICCRSNRFVMPCGIKCGMGISEVTNLLRSKYRPPQKAISTDYGVLTMTGPEGFPYVFVYFKNSFIERIVIWSGNE